VIKVFQTPTFVRQKKKLNKSQIRDLDKAIKRLVSEPQTGVQKIGDLKDIWIYKFKMAKQLHLLAYQWDEESRTLIALGVHENFYRDLKRQIK
jgi:mRNA-degrading endonuclease RelE of RelBE toxin-antitoxin system